MSIVSIFIRFTQNEYEWTLCILCVNIHLPNNTDAKVHMHSVHSEWNESTLITTDSDLVYNERFIMKGIYSGLP